MKKMKLALVLLVFAAMTGIANAGGVGYIDMPTILDKYDYAQRAKKEVEAKELELQQYILDKDKEYKTLDTPLKKQTFEQKTAQQYKTKEDAYIQLRNKREQEVDTKVREAAKAVMVEQKLDAIIDQRTVYVGGLDITNLVLNKLKGIK